MPYNYSQEQWRNMELEIGYDLRACLTYNTSEYLTPANIKRVVAVYEGENERENWRWIIELKDDTFVFLDAGCDYTGWDCQSWISIEEKYTTVLGCLRSCDNEEVRKALHAQVMGEVVETWREKMDKEFGIHSETGALINTSVFKTLEEVLPVEIKEQITPYLVEQAAATVRERQQSYNSPVKNFADIAKCWSVIVGVEITSEQVALMMIQMKVLRENFKHQDDNIIDIAGYAICLEQVIKAKGE